MTYRELYDYGVANLESAEISEAKLDARLLLEFVCHTDRNALLVHGEDIRSEIEETAYKQMITKRASHIPLQHITGQQDFMGLSFHVNEHTLIPRQDTEILVEETLKYLKSGMRVLDMCTGSGCILLSLLHYCKGCTGDGVDISEEALQVARKNAKDLGLFANFIHSNLFENVSEKYAVIVSNPPYIATKEIESLMPEVRDFEPMQALDGFEDGLYFYRQIILQVKEYIHDNALIVFEIGYDQGEAVKAMMEENGFHQVEVVKDYAGLDRVVKGIR